MDPIDQKPEKEQALRMLKILANPVIEIRAIGGGPIMRGYFSDHEKAAAAATRMSETGGRDGLYVTVNELSSELGSLADNTVKLGTATKDADISRFRHLVLDIDPIRPPGIKAAATDEEHEAALATGREVVAFTKEQGWPEPMAIDSGNGNYVVFAVDLENDCGNKALVNRVLEAFDAKFTSATAKIDQAVGNPSRIFRLAGTINRKGSSTVERPHRMARIISAPANETLQAVSVEQLRTLADELLGTVETLYLLGVEYRVLLKKRYLLLDLRPVVVRVGLLERARIHYGRSVFALLHEPAKLLGLREGQKERTGEAA